MAKFRVCFSGLEHSAEMFAGSAAELRAADAGIAAAKRGLRQLGGATYFISLALGLMERSVLSRAFQIDSLTDAIQESGLCYRETEQHVVFLEDGTRAAARGRVSDAQMRQMDQYMQQELQELLGEDRYSRDVWEQASLEERKDILNAYLQELTAVMGLSVGSIHFIDEKGTKDGYLMGSYNSDTNQVSINQWVLEHMKAEDSYALLLTVAHELRHAYQQMACDHPERFIVEGETIEDWQYSIDHYRNTNGFIEEGMDAGEAYIAYRNQLIEQDARWFAGQE